MSTTASTSSTQSALALSGLASGMNWTAIVSELLQVEAAPETQMTSDETTDQNENAGFQTIGTDLAALETDLKTLSNPSFFQSRTTSLSNPDVASATAGNNTALGTYALDVAHLATNSVQVGTTAAAPLSSTDDVSNVTLSSAGFATPVTAGTFTVNGQSVTVTTGESLQDVFTAIGTATNNAVTASYDSSTDEITLSSNSAITLGSDTDTSNFLQAAELYGNGGDTVTSAAPLGGINLTDTLDSANFATPVSDGGSGAGAFTINGVTINFDASTDSVSDVLQAINNSGAGVTATYDSTDNRFELTDNSTGDVGISMQDVTGNFLAASGLSGGTLQAGQNLQYTINNGGTLYSQSNTVNAGNSGISGLSITATGAGVTNITVGSDTSTIASTIGQFVTDYNSVQSYISSQTVTTTSSTGTVTAGLFTGNLDVENIAFTLRQMMDATPSGGTAGAENLNDLGIASNGNDNTLASPDTTTLDSALTNNLSAVQNLFTNATTGLATTLSTYVNGLTTANTGVLATDETNATSQAKSEANSISTLQSKITNDQTTLDNQFAAMETTIESINTEKQYLDDYFGASGSTAQSAPTAAGSGTSS